MSINKLEYKRRNLSGVYIFEKFDFDQTRQPTCFEDCTEETQNKFLDGLSNESLKSLAKKLADELITLADYAGVTKE